MTLSTIVRTVSCSLVATFLFGVVSIAAQGGVFATLSGTVRDGTDAVVPDATVTLVMASTNAEQRASTDQSGRFTFPRVVPGVYVLRVEKGGFRGTTLEDIALAVNDALTQDVRLEAGEVTETVTVSGTATGVQTRGGGVSLVVDARTVRELPLNGKDWSRLISLAPGAGLTNTSPVSGVRNPYGSYTVDGLGNNNERSSGQPLSGGAAEFNGPNLISSEAVQEFRIITANADATFGRSSGAQVNVITKSGTNTLRGSAYEFMRDDALDARDFFNHGPFFDEGGRAAVPPLKQHLFGGTVGGPLQKDRQFYFVSYEGFRQERQVTSAFTFPNSDLIQLMPGDLGRLYRAYYLDRGLVTSTTGPGQFSTLTPTDRSAAIAAGFDARLFDGNPANGEAGTLLQSATVPQDVTQDSIFVKTDRVLPHGWRVSGRFGYANPERTGPQFSLGSPIDLSIDTRQWRSALGEVVGVLSPSHVLEVRAGWTQSKMTTPPLDGVGSAFRAIGVPDDLGILVNPAGTGLNSAGLLGTSAFLDNQRIPQASVLHTWQRGQLTLRSGMDLAGFTIDIHNGAGRPTYTFTGFVGANGLLGSAPGQAQATATSAAASIFGVNGGPTSALRQVRSSSQEYYTQADLRLTQRLTVNAGVRYSYAGTWKERDNAIANLYAVDESGTAVKNVHPFAFGRTSNRLEPAGAEMYVSDKNNVQPRLGVAWVTSGGSTAVRGAYGAYDERLFQLVFSAQGGLVNNPPFTLASNAANVPFTLGGPLPVSTGTLSIFGLDPTLRSPRTHRVSAGVEHELAADMNVTADYVGTFGRGLFGVVDVNGAAGVPQALRPDPRFSTLRLIANTSSSDYHALQLTARRRFERGVSFTVAYTLARARDDSSVDTFGIFPGLVNTGASSASGFQGGGAEGWTDRPRDADWGPTLGIPTHLLVASHIIELPFGRDRRWMTAAPAVIEAIGGGWSLTGILSLRSGEPFNLSLGADANDDGDTNERPALFGGSLSDLLAGDGAGKTQFLVSRDQAIQILGAPAAASDPFAVIGRNALTGPFVWYYDVSFSKRAALTPRMQLTIEVNAFNVFNRANFGTPVATLSDARFGRITATATGTTPRQLQLGARLSF